MQRIISNYLKIGFVYNSVIMLNTRVNTDEPNFKMCPSFYYRKILHANIFRLLCFPWSIYEYIRYPKLRSLTYPPNIKTHEELYWLYLLECNYEIEEDLLSKELFLYNYLQQRKLVYQ